MRTKCNRQLTMQRKWKIRMQNFWQQEYRILDVKNRQNLTLIKYSFSVYHSIAFSG